MLYLICTSLLGFIIISRILSLLEKSKLFSRQKIVGIASFLILPLYFFSFFKEPSILSLIYIGIILGILIQLRIFFRKKIKSVYEKCHLRLLDTITFNIKAGFSPLKSMEMAIHDQNFDEKQVFAHFLMNSDNKSIELSGPHIECEQFSREIHATIQSRIKILDRLKELKRSYKIIFDLRHRSRQATQQARGQAFFALAIYIVLFFISCREFKLTQFPMLMLGSLFLFLIGFYLIFKLGEKIKWTV